MILRLLFLALFLACLAAGKPAEGWSKLVKSHEMVFEGDMIISREAVERAIKTGDMKQEEVKKTQDPNAPIAEGITAPLFSRWEGGVVPYTIDSKLGCSGVFCWFTGAVKEIEEAMRIWSTKTCITFRPKTATDKNWIHFKDSKWGHCAAHIGRIGGEQFVYLGKFCRKTGIVLHEIGHALGFFHEQSRPDRDDHVTIKLDNVKKGHEHNFKKYTTYTSDMKTPYDYGSIMHYGEKEFNKWWFKTVVPKVKGVKIGQRKRLSCWDVAEMNRYYECPKKYIRDCK